jgi:pSer/pThr/pTyr-binding forkhead associated (FHA) protein
VAGDGSYDIGPNRALIGRSSDADVMLPFDEVSRRHALIWRADSQAWITDLGSANGTEVDGVRIGSIPHLLNRGDMIGFSGHRFRFHEGPERA